jgi:hypothetical protein
MKYTKQSRKKRPWSKLGREIRALFAPNIPVQIHCSTLPLQGKEACGSTKFPRYWITLNKETIFDYPKQFMDLPDHNAEWWDKKRADTSGQVTVRNCYPYERHGVSEISVLIRDYIDRPRETLFEPFENDRWGLTDILKALDRRIGKRRLLEMKTENPGALKVISLRLNQENANQDVIK